MSGAGPVFSIVPCALLALAAGCRARTASTPVPPARSEVAPADAGSPAEAPEPANKPLFELPEGWQELTDLAFERALDAWLPPGEQKQLREGDLSALARSLGAGDRSAVRAAVLLARTGDARAGEALLARLEERAAAPPGLGASKESGVRVAVDVVAAAAFDPTGEPQETTLSATSATSDRGSGANAARGLASARDAGARLIALAVGKRAHPELPVRVECARSALALGRDETIPWLLLVLREGTRPPGTGRALPGAVGEEDLAWAQSRAAEALSLRAGTPCRFRPEGSVREREEEAQRLETLLPPPRKKR